MRITIAEASAAWCSKIIRRAEPGETIGLTRYCRPLAQATRT